MKIACIAMIPSVHCNRHVNLLAEAGHDIHLLVLIPFGRFIDDLHPGVQVHLMPTAFGASGFDPKGRRNGPRRIREALAKTLGSIPQWSSRSLVYPPELSLPPQRTPEPQPLLDSFDPVVIENAKVFQPDPVGATRWTATMLDALEPDIVHSFCIHQASYVAYLARSLCQKPFPVWMVSCWGYDIEFYRRRPHHQYSIRKVLETCDLFFPECHRDAALARAFGYGGPTLAVDYIGAGWDLAHFRSLRQPTPGSSRRAIIVKGIESIVNRPLDALAGIELVASELRDYRVLVYSANALTERIALAIGRRAGLNLEVLPRLPYDELMRCVGQAKISIATSSADGICTTALEAMVMGSIPIQTDTSCFGEWIQSGLSGFLVPDQNPDAVAEAIRYVVNNDAWVDNPVEINDRIADARLDKVDFSRRIVRMYEQALGLREPEGSCVTTCRSRAATRAVAT
jgi:glycosyltransferase involved in cell wall biosynthesis